MNLTMVYFTIKEKSSAILVSYIHNEFYSTDMHAHYSQGHSFTVVFINLKMVSSELEWTDVSFIQQSLLSYIFIP